MIYVWYIHFGCKFHTLHSFRYNVIYLAFQFSFSQVIIISVWRKKKLWQENICVLHIFVMRWISRLIDMQAVKWYCIFYSVAKRFIFNIWMFCPQPSQFTPSVQAQQRNIYGEPTAPPQAAPAPALFTPAPHVSQPPVCNLLLFFLFFFWFLSLFPLFCFNF